MILFGWTHNPLVAGSSPAGPTVKWVLYCGLCYKVTNDLFNYFTLLVASYNTNLQHFSLFPASCTIFDVQKFIGQCEGINIQWGMFLSLNYLLLSIAIERIEIPLHDPSMINQKRVVRSISSLDPLWNPNLEVID